MATSAKEEALANARIFLDPSRIKHKELLTVNGAVNLLLMRSPIVGGPDPQEVVLTYTGVGQRHVLARRRGSQVTVSPALAHLTGPRNTVNGILIEMGSPWRLRPVGYRLLAYGTGDGSAQASVVSPTADLDPMTMQAHT